MIHCTLLKLRISILQYSYLKEWRCKLQSGRRSFQYISNTDNESKIYKGLQIKKRPTTQKKNE